MLPDFEKDFPYIASRAELDKYIGCYVPWHWHKTVKLFYMKSGSIEYDTPGGKLLFPDGSGGMVNANVLHMTKAMSQREKIYSYFIFSMFPYLLGNREAAVILEKFFGNMHIVRPKNIGGNGRIVIDKGRNEISFLRPLVL